MGYEGLEVINPEGGTEDAEEEAQRGRWKQEVQYFFPLSFHYADASFYFAISVIFCLIFQSYDGY